MQIPIVLASIFGPFLMILGAWVLFYNENMLKIGTSIKNIPAAQHLMGMFNLIVGLTIINLYNVWDWHLTLLVTLLGWISFARGILIHFLPQVHFKLSMNEPSGVKVVGIIRLAWGFGLCWLAFWI